MNKTYTKPFGHPQHWRFSEDQELATAIRAYLESQQLLPAQQIIVVEYVRYFLEAPAFDSRPMMPYVRENLKQIKTRQDLETVLQQAQMNGIVPL